MILQRLVFPQGNRLMFGVNCTVDGKKYCLKDDESYYIKIASDSVSAVVVYEFTTDSDFFDIDSNLPRGMYIFELGIKNNDNVSTVLVPAYDEKGKPMTQMIILERIL